VLYVGVADAQHRAWWDPLNEGGYVPRTNVSSGPPGKDRLYSSVRWRLEDPPRYRDVWAEPAWPRVEAEVGCRSDRALMPIDVRFGTEQKPHPGFSTTWWSGVPFTAVAVHDLSPAGHLQRARELTAGGYRPGSVAAADGGAEVVSASVWVRPVVSEARREALAARQANAAAAAFLLDQPEVLWKAVQRGDDRRLGAFLAVRLAALEVDPRALLERLGDEPAPAARRTLLRALAESAPASWPASLRSEAAARLGLVWRADPDPGVHSAVDLVLRRGGLAVPAPAGAAVVQPERPAAPSAPSWYVDLEGHTMAVLPGPLTFTMGSPGHEVRREHHDEPLHDVTLDRTIAIATREVTVAQFLKHRPSHPIATRYSQEPDAPANMISWFDAASYCNFLSNRAGLPRAEWCYPDEPCDQAVSLAGTVERTGYRLPTDTEWEYACRAGTATARPYGDSETLLSKYAWTVADADYRTHPVGLLLPNDFGLFDMLGNVLEWCLDGEHHTGDLDQMSIRPIRGGSFLYMPSSARAAQRAESRANNRQPYLGFRVARTLHAAKERP
jgi:formylglycine-generating enzyme required for sulfatase activity